MNVSLLIYINLHESEQHTLKFHDVEDSKVNNTLNNIGEMFTCLGKLANMILMITLNINIWLGISDECTVDCTSFVSLE